MQAPGRWAPVKAGPFDWRTIMSEPGLVDITGRLRSPAAMPGHWAGCVPPNKGLRFPANPPTVEEIILVMREAGAGRTLTGCVGWSRSCGAQGYGSAKRLLSLRPIWTRRPARSWSAPARAGSDGWSGWITERGSTSPVGPNTGSSCPSVPCSASSPDLPAAAVGQRQLPGVSSVGLRSRLASGGGSRRTSCGTLTRSRWRTKGSRCRLSRGSLGMPTSGSRRFTSRESTRERSWTPSTTAGHR